MSTPVVSLPPPEEVERQIDALQDELAALRRLLRASQAVAKANEARKRRLTSPGENKGGEHDA